MSTSPAKELADLICKTIIKKGGLTLDEIEERCAKRNLDMDLVYEAMELVSKRPKITTSGKRYVEKVVKKYDPHAGTTWIKDNYPKMIPGVNDASHPVFDGIDYSWMFLTPAEMKEYKLSLKGGYGGIKYGANSRRKNTNRYS